MYFHFRSMRNSFINKVTRVHKVLTVANVPPFWLCFMNSSWSTGLKFPTWTHNRILPSNRASPVTGLIWRAGPLVPLPSWLITLSTALFKYFISHYIYENQFSSSLLYLWQCSRKYRTALQLQLQLSTLFKEYFTIQSKKDWSANSIS